ncbi:Piso0_000783 [Millerozyma farinosa CBS 7064]|uniref:Piso0_000783 protein n=1 Tax=Pichia sorbitophila (strain ATCC MYA-4447 / BCRC 22081 / CBS 7064 / NBRC 10061 / NRRL Y-12695) TaxID=559304 RepID=G8YQ19_PICSO|nr:Piso0_000783 [Millerozyma farinosa CBS 7064]
MVSNSLVHRKLQDYKFILASSSPRRLEILKTNLHIHDVTVIPSEFDEGLDKSKYSPEQYVSETAALKGDDVLKKTIPTADQSFILLSSDTVIVCDGNIFEKPTTKERQWEMFQAYRKHPDVNVISAVRAIKYDTTTHKVSSSSQVATTKLCFRANVTDDLLQDYIDSEEGLLAAGGFKFQESGCLLFSGIEGDYFNIVGLPVAATYQVLSELL